MQWCRILRLRHKIAARQFRAFLCTKHYWNQRQANLNIGRNSKMMRWAETALPWFFNSWIWIQVCVFQIGSSANCLQKNCHFFWCKGLLVWTNKKYLRAKIRFIFYQPSYNTYTEFFQTFKNINLSVFSVIWLYTSAKSTYYITCFPVYWVFYKKINKTNPVLTNSQVFCHLLSECVSYKTHYRVGRKKSIP